MVITSAVSLIDIACDDAVFANLADWLARELNIKINHNSDAQYRIDFQKADVFLCAKDPRRHGPIAVDFCAGAQAHRRYYGGGKGQLIAKAIGLSTKITPNVLDATAGLGADAFVMATLGCRVQLVERSPIAFVLLQAGLLKAQRWAEENRDVDLSRILARMSLSYGDSQSILQQRPDDDVDVVYLDPMFPEKQKSAAVKKEMQAFHHLMGVDTNESSLLNVAREKAKFRVVVKRPKLAPSIGNVVPQHQIHGKSGRYDLYIKRSIEKGFLGMAPSQDVSTRRP